LGFEAYGSWALASRPLEYGERRLDGQVRLPDPDTTKTIVVANDCADGNLSAPF